MGDEPELSLSLTWDPYGRDGLAAPLGGDLRGVLLTVEDRLSETQEAAVVLGAKAITLAELGQNERALAAVRRMVEVCEGRADRLPMLLARSRLYVALVLAERGEHAEAEQAMDDVASFYGSAEDPALRAVAASALKCRIPELRQMAEAGRIRDAWRSLHAAHDSELDPEIRRTVAQGGQLAAGYLLNAGRRAEAIATADEVIALYESDPDPAIRTDVAVAMLVRFNALRHWQFLASYRAAQALVHFIGSSPKQELIEALRHTDPAGAEKFLRKAHDPH